MNVGFPVDATKYLNLQNNNLPKKDLRTNASVVLVARFRSKITFLKVVGSVARSEQRNASKKA